MHIKHEVRERPLQPRSQAPIDGESRPRNFGSALKIEHTELLAELPMRSGSKVKLRRRTPAADFYIIFGSLSYRHAFIWQVGKTGQDLLQPGFQVYYDF